MIIELIRNNSKTGNNGRTFTDIINNFEKYLKVQILKLVNKSCKCLEIEKFCHILFTQMKNNNLKLTYQIFPIFSILSFAIFAIIFTQIDNAKKRIAGIFIFFLRMIIFIIT